MSVQAVPLAEEFSALAVQSSIEAEGVDAAVGRELRVEEIEKIYLAVGRGLRVEEIEEIIYLAVGRGLRFEEVEQIFYLAGRSGLNADETDTILFLAVRSGLKAYDALSLAFRTGLKSEKEVYARLLEQLLASFDCRKEDRELQEWQRPPCMYGKSREDHKNVPFYLFKIKYSAKKAQVSWWQKKYARFPPERPGYNIAVRVARLTISTDGVHLEQAGEDGQPGALSYHLDLSYRGRPDPGGEGLRMPASVREVAVIKRLPAGDGLAILSNVRGLGVKLHDILFVMQWAGTVALSFTEKSFYVSSKFIEEPLYATHGLNFIDITFTVENLVRKLYHLYEQEEQEKNIMHEKKDDLESEELMLQREELERKKLEDLQRRRAERKKNKSLRMEMKESLNWMKDRARTEKKQEQHKKIDEALYTSIHLFSEESDWVSPSEEDVCQSEVRCLELHKDPKSTLQIDQLDLGGGAGRARDHRNHYQHD